MVLVDMLWSSFQGTTFLPMCNCQVEWPSSASCFLLCFILSEKAFSGMTHVEWLGAS